MNAKFITLDGIDGAGKTTQLDVIRHWFERQNLSVCFTREPGGTPLGENLRQLLLHPDTRAHIRTETLLMFAARQQHLHDVILPALAAGTHIVCDRFTDATFAYQGGGRGVPAADIAVLEQWVQGSFRPDLTILLDIPIDLSQQRLAQSRDKDRFEREPPQFFQAVRQSYLQRAAAAPERYAIIDSSRDKAIVRSDIEAVLDQLFAA